MVNVASFEEFDDERQIAAHQIGLPRVVLEGQDDVRLFRMYWFRHLAGSFEFVEAKELTNAAGCSAVEAAVVASREVDGIPAFGFVDRDTFFRSKKWHLLFAIDDAAFAEATTSEDLHTTSRWEVEAYLLEPDLIASLSRSLAKRRPAAEHVGDVPLRIAIEECENLLQAQRMLGAAHVCRVKYADGHFVDLSGAEFIAACEAELSGLELGHATAAEIAERVDAVLAAAPDEPAARLRWLLRYVDTKRLIRRLSRRLEVQPEVRWFLAEMMLQSNRRPAELEGKLSQIKARFGG